MFKDNIKLKILGAVAGAGALVGGQYLMYQYEKGQHVRELDLKNHKNSAPDSLKKAEYNFFHMEIILNVIFLQSLIPQALKIGVISEFEKNYRASQPLKVLPQTYQKNKNHLLALRMGTQLLNPLYRPLNKQPPRRQKC